MDEKDKKIAALQARFAKLEEALRECRNRADHALRYRTPESMEDVMHGIVALCDKQLDAGERARKALEG
jgi:hypothetical protein